MVHQSRDTYHGPCRLILCARLFRDFRPGTKSLRIPLESENTRRSFSCMTFQKGVRDGLAIGLGYLSVSFLIRYHGCQFGAYLVAGGADIDHVSDLSGSGRGRRHHGGRWADSLRWRSRSLSSICAIRLWPSRCLRRLISQ